MFQKAVKTESKLRLAISGPSGSGKTYTALSIASHLTDKPIALVDTEHGSASKYADLFSFDVLNLDPPYHPERFLEAIREATEAGYGIIIVDSLTHAWNGTGGMLDIVDEISRKDRNANTFAAWKRATPIQNKLIDGIISSDIHVITTMRSKQDYVQEKDDNGKTVVKKMGMNPIQRDGFEYEMDVFLEMDIDNTGMVTKSRCTAINGKVISKPGKQLAETLKVWLSGSPAPAKVTPLPRQEPAPQTPAPIRANGHANGNGAATPNNGKPAYGKAVEIPANASPAVRALMECGAADSIASAAGMLNKLKLAGKSIKQIHDIGKAYRAWRDTGIDSDTAAEKTLAGELVPA